MKRIETGALQINEDWTGLFVRGDDTFALKEVLEKSNVDDLSPTAVWFRAWLIGVIDEHVNEMNLLDERDVQRIKVELPEV